LCENIAGFCIPNLWKISVLRLEKDNVLKKEEEETPPNTKNIKIVLPRFGLEVLKWKG
jgi:hypothetical protein